MIAFTFFEESRAKETEGQKSRALFACLLYVHVTRTRLQARPQHTNARKRQSKKINLIQKEKKVIQNEAHDSQQIFRQFKFTYFV
jgi:hypothetical protein